MSLTGAQKVPPGQSPGSGSAALTYDAKLLEAGERYINLHSKDNGGEIRGQVMLPTGK